MPSYLISFTVGDIAMNQTSERISVLAEPLRLDDVRTKLKDADSWLTAIENYLSPFFWGQNLTIYAPPTEFPLTYTEDTNFIQVAETIFED